MTDLPEMDFETYSEAGYNYRENRWRSIVKSGSPGLSAVGASVYSEHPSAEALCLAYDLKDGLGGRLWAPGMHPPEDLIKYIQSGGAIEAHNSSFEYYIWSNICVKKLGWPELPFWQLRDSKAKAKAWGLPGALGKIGEILQVGDQKDKEGTRLINKFCKPRNPTQKDSRLRITPFDDSEDGTKLYNYCLTDIKAEAAISARMPDLTHSELEVWLVDQQINFRGVYIDEKAVDDCIFIIDRATEAYTQELQLITNGAVKSAGEIAKMREWLTVDLPALDADTIKQTFKRDDLLPQDRRVLEIRSSLASSSVKKLFSIKRRLSADGRLRGLFEYCGAERTGRFAGRGPQPQNLPNSGPLPVWGIEQVEMAFMAISTRDFNTVETLYGDAIGAVAGCLRGLFSAAPGHDLICSDYSAIEAVVLSYLAGEQWRMSVFEDHGKIYEMSAAKITGIPFPEFMEHKKRTGDHHPMRKKVGKVAELACFGVDTLVLTNNGWKCIVDISMEDLIHDGVEFVEHHGVEYQGTREVINLSGVFVTPDHKIYYGSNNWGQWDWETAAELKKTPFKLEYALSKVEFSVGQDPNATYKCVIPVNKDSMPPACAWCLDSKSMYSLDGILWKRPPLDDNGHTPVYDIINCGPRSRFVIMTSEGPLIVHNSGYQGGLGAWKAFGADKFMSDAEIQINIKKWREESPNIVNFWYGLQNVAIAAVKLPGTIQEFKGIEYQVLEDVLYCKLLSGRRLAYHQPRLTPDVTPWGKQVDKLSYMGTGLNKNWIRLDTYGGKLCENVVQATARDILTHAMVQLEKKGYPIVLHIHDEVVCEVPENVGSVEEVEAIMADLPDWCKDWPVKAAGGWRGKRYRKD